MPVDKQLSAASVLLMMLQSFLEYVLLYAIHIEELGADVYTFLSTVIMLKWNFNILYICRLE